MKRKAKMVIISRYLSLISSVWLQHVDHMIDFFLVQFSWTYANGCILISTSLSVWAMIVPLGECASLLFFAMKLPPLFSLFDCEKEVDAWVAELFVWPLNELLNNLLCTWMLSDPITNTHPLQRVEGCRPIDATTNSASPPSNRFSILPYSSLKSLTHSNETP